MRKFYLRFFPKLYFFLMFFFLFICCATDLKADDNNAPHIVLQLKWYHQFQFAGYYAAKEKGFYSDAGLDVEILEGGPKIKVQDEVISGKADFGVLASELVALRAQGLKVVALAPIIQHSTRTIIARKDRDISSPHNLIGKAVMLNKNELPEFMAMFLNEGLDFDSLNIIDKTKSANQRFITGDIDAINGSVANQPYLFLRKGIPYTLIKPNNYGIDFYGDTLFTTEEIVKKGPELVRAFMNASFKGWKYAFDNPDEIIDVILEKYSAKKSKEHLNFEQHQLRNLAHPDLVEIGHNNTERWLHIKETYQRLGVVSADFSLQGFLLEDYLQENNVWISRLAIALGVICVICTVIFLYNFQLRKDVKNIADKIQARSEYLRITLSSIGDAVISADLAGNIVTMNPVAEKLTGWSFNDAKGLGLNEVFNIVNAKTREPAENPVEKALKTGRIVELANHTILISKKGKEYQIADSAAPMKDARGNFIGVVMVFRDVTSEYQNMEQIINLGKFPSQNPHPVMRVTPDGLLRYGNRGSQHLLEHWKCQVNSPIPERWHKRVQLAIKENRIKQFEEEYSKGWVSLSIMPVKEGNYANIYGMDITEQKEHFERFKTVMDSLDALVYVADMETYELLFVNKYGLDIMGDIIGKICWQALQADQTGPCSFCTNSQLLDSDSMPLDPIIWEFQNTLNGEWYECRDQAIRWIDGRMVRMEIATNITERKKAESERKKLEEELRQSHKLEAIGTMAGGIAHDFNNILGIIIGNTELALDDIPAWSPAKQSLNEIKIASQRASEVVKQLLNFSRKSEEAKENINTGQSLLEAVSLLRASIPATIKVKTNIPDEDYIINANPTQFQQVLINLCTNAAHSMEQNGGELSIGLSEFKVDQFTRALYQEINPGTYVQLTVKDTGCGIDPKIQEKIFDPYFTTKKTGKGTGMGLSVVLGIVKNHEGAITVYSEPSKGTIFKILFPRVSDEAGRKEEAIQSPQLGSERVLFVDDEPGLTNIGKLMLEKLGYSVETENDPSAALEMVKQFPEKFDLVITDMTMPNMSGEQLIREVLQVNPKLPVILTTGFNNRIDRETAAALGAKQYLEKPFNRTQLGQAIKEVLSSSNRVG
ncbi:MAG: ABC transporter substrate-binding protein [Desulfobacterales bacterium]|nr:ABC transporter substrate-binding protein [Desulfobacterales bacterium]